MCGGAAFASGGPFGFGGGPGSPVPSLVAGGGENVLSIDRLSDFDLRCGSSMHGPCGAFLLGLAGIAAVSSGKMMLISGTWSFGKTERKFFPSSVTCVYHSVPVYGPWWLIQKSE